MTSDSKTAELVVPFICAKSFSILFISGDALNTMAPVFLPGIFNNGGCCIFTPYSEKAAIIRINKCIYNIIGKKRQQNNFFVFWFFCDNLYP